MLLVRFLLVVQLVMQIKFNVNNFARVAGGCDWPIQ